MRRGGPTLAQFTPPNANQADLAGGCQAFCSRPRERRPLRIFVLGRGDRQVSSRSCAFEFSCSLVSLAAHAVAQPQYLRLVSCRCRVTVELVSLVSLASAGSFTCAP